MKVYHEIYPAEGWAKKILEYLQKVADEKPNMYAKTKKRYEDLAYSLLDSASLIASILEEDSLVPHSNDEFDELSTSTGVSIQDKLNQVSQRFKLSEDFSSSKIPPGKTDPQESGYYNICKYYDTIFYEASHTNFGYSEVNECARLLYLWFHTRFMPEVRDPNFVCQIRYLPTWITNFIITYGKYFQLGKIASFQKIISQWCEKVKSGSGGVYTIPFEIYRVEKDFKNGLCQPLDYTIEAVVINDILVSECLYKLGDDECKVDIRYNPGDLAIIVRDRNPSLFNPIRSRIAKRSQLIREIGLTPIGGIDVNE